LGLAVVAFLGLLAIAGVQSYRDLSRAHAQELELEQQIAATQGRIEALERRLERLASDPGTLERLAREELGLVKPGDVVIVLPPAAEPAEPPSAETLAPSKD
jgi:cell division protein FtsB